MENNREEIKDISIGKDSWIKWIELDPGDDNLFDIDPLLESTKNFWLDLETHCVAECCGIDAFALWPEDIKNAATSFSEHGLKQQLLTIKDAITKTECNIVISKRLNNLFHKRVFIQLLDHIIGCI